MVVLNLKLDHKYKLRGTDRSGDRLGDRLKDGQDFKPRPA